MNVIAGSRKAVLVDLHQVLILGIYGPTLSPCDLGAVKPARAVGKIAAAAADVLMATVGTLLMGMAEGKPKKITAAEYLHNVKARQEYNQQRAEEARREEKREASLDALRGGRPLEASMLQNFNRQDLEQIKASGAIEGVQQILHEQERQREERERERTREHNGPPPHGQRREPYLPTGRGERNAMQRDRAFDSPAPENARPYGAAFPAPRVSPASVE